MNIEIYFDGACWNQKDKSMPIGMGVAVFIEKEYDEELSRAWGVSVEELKERGTSNTAEWHACVEAFRVAKDLKKGYPTCKIRVFSDSQIITNQFNGDCAINSEHMKTHKRNAHNYSHGSGCRKVEWISRKFNKQADKLSKEGLHLVK